VAAASATERVAAKLVLAEVTLGELREHPVVPYESDAVTRLIKSRSSNSRNSLKMLLIQA